MTTFILLRHAQSVGSLAHLVLGTMESPLTAQGAHDTRAKMEIFRGHKPSFFATSTLGRAWETCVIVAQGFGQSEEGILVDGRFTERFVGSAFQGKTLDEVESLIGEEEIAHFMSLTPQARLHYKFALAPDAELPVTAAERLRSGLVDLARAHPGETGLVVSSAAVIASLLAQAEPEEFVGLFGGDAIPNLAHYIIDVGDDGTLTFT